MSSKLYNKFNTQEEDYKKSFKPETKIEKRRKYDNKEEENNINENRLPNGFNDLSYDNNQEE